MIVRENINFQRGMDAKKSLKIGMEDILQVPIRDYSLMPPGYYKVWAEDKWDKSSFFYCHVKKTKEGETYLIKSWITVYKNGKEKKEEPLKEPVLIGYDQNGYTAWERVNKVYHIEYLGPL